ncbi:hypothetical protein B0G69_8112 [Paraburkholderia sp. RAU2J]|nr:hypothetical protein B0G69_8112 [Paraburkholderia sp. RAU2J]
MADTRQVTRPIALARPRGAHRFEAFSPKLARRVMLVSGSPEPFVHARARKA